MTEKVLGLFVDGVLQTPSETNVHLGGGEGGCFNFYKVVFQGTENFVNFYLDPNSLVRVNSQRYINNASRMEPTNGGYSTVMLEWSVSDDDLFLGNSELYGVSTKGCELDSVHLTITGTDKERYHLENAEISNSTLWDTSFKGAAVITDSELVDSSITCEAGEFYRATLVDTELSTNKLIHIANSTLEDCRLTAMDGDLFISRCTLRDTIAYVPRLSLLSVFHTFEVNLLEAPKQKIAVRFFRTVKGKYILCDDNGWWVWTDFEDARGRLMDLGKYWDQPMTESMADYILDCAKSRIKLIEMMEAKKETLNDNSAGSGEEG